MLLLGCSFRNFKSWARLVLSKHVSESLLLPSSPSQFSFMQLICSDGDEEDIQRRISFSELEMHQPSLSGPGVDSTILSPISCSSDEEGSKMLQAERRYHL